MNFKNYLFFLSALTFCLQSKAATGPVKYYTEMKTMLDYKEAMKPYNKPQIIKCYTNSCGACKTMEPGFNKLAKENPNIAFWTANVETDELKGLIEKHSMKAIPTTLFVKDGKVIDSVKGAMVEDDLREQVKSFKSKY